MAFIYPFNAASNACWNTEYGWAPVIIVPLMRNDGVELTPALAAARLLLRDDVRVGVVIDATRERRNVKPHLLGKL